MSVELSAETEATGDSAGEGRRLRVGLLVDSFVQPRWVRRVVEDIQNSSFAEIVLVVRNRAGAAGAGRDGLHKKLWANKGHLLYVAYTKLDGSLFKVRQDAFEKVGIDDLLPACAVIDVAPVMTKHSDYFSEESVREIRAHDLDVALRFGFRILRGDALRIARHGVWSYHHGDGQVNRGGPPGFWEVMQGTALTGSMLQVLTEELDGGQVLCRSWSSTNEKFSVRRNKNNYYWKSSAFVLRKLRELYECEGQLPADGDEGQATFRLYNHRLYKKPTNAEMLPLLAGLARRAAEKVLLDAAFTEQWCLAYRFKPEADNAGDAIYRFKYLVPPKGRFWADPFPVKAGDKYFVFFEEYLDARGKAHISAAELGRGGMVGEPFKVLEQDYHLSYPFVFEWQGDYYMIPESGANETIELYRCVSFPSEWKLERVLMEGVRAADTTLAEVDGTWWMFVNIAPDPISYNYDELHIFYAQSPMGPWLPHRRRPVKSDARGARPAGHLFRWRGDLYRPAQDCSKRYGYAISINKILRLSPEEFREEEVSKILPEWDKRVVATHTLNSCAGLTVIDCLRRRGRLF